MQYSIVVDVSQTKLNWLELFGENDLCFAIKGQFTDIHFLFSKMSSFFRIKTIKIR